MRLLGEAGPGSAAAPHPLASADRDGVGPARSPATMAGWRTSLAGRSRSASASPPGSTWWRRHRRARSPTTRHVLEERRAAGLNGVDAVHVPQPGALHRSGAHPARRPAPSSSAPAPTTATRRPGPTGAGPVARVARYVWADDQDRAARRRSGRGRRPGRRRAPGVRRVRPEPPGRPARRPAAPASAGTARTPTCCCPGTGRWFLLGSVLTDAPPRHRRRRPARWPTGAARASAASPACPTGAIVAPGVVDARRCLSWSLQAPASFPRDQRVALGDRLYGCDDCQEVCPPNRSARRRVAEAAGATGRPRRRLGPGARAARRRPTTSCSTATAAGTSPTATRATSAATPCVVLGNVGDGDDPAVVDRPAPAACTDPDPLLRAHAVWSARRLGCDDLLVV